MCTRWSPIIDGLDKFAHVVPYCNRCTALEGPDVHTIIHSYGLHSRREVCTPLDVKRTSVAFIRDDRYG